MQPIPGSSGRGGRTNTKRQETHSSLSMCSVHQLAAARPRAFLAAPTMFATAPKRRAAALSIVGLLAGCDSFDHPLDGRARIHGANAHVRVLVREYAKDLVGE